MKRPLIAFQALLASSAVLCQSGEASNTYIAPDHLDSSIEARIKDAQTGDWSSMLDPEYLEGDLVAKSKWKNGKGRKFGNSRGSGKWKNGKSGNKWSNSRNTWGNGGYHGGWRNGGGGWRNGSGGFVNW